MSRPHRPLPDVAQLQGAVQALLPWMVQTLSELVAAPSLSGAEQPAVDVFEAQLRALGLVPERIRLDSRQLEGLPLFSCPCDPDGGRDNLLARHLPPGHDDDAEDRPRGRSLLFNGHLDVVPTGPEALWQHPPFAPRVVDGWLQGRGAGDMKGGLVCALAAYKALADLGWQPAGIVGFNAVVDEENTGNGTLATVHALRQSLARARLTDFDAVIIPEPFGETLMRAQVGVLWLQATLTGRPAHVGYMRSGLNPIEAAYEVLQDLRRLQQAWNEPQVRPPEFRDVAQPININLGRIEGGEWTSSVPCTCTLHLRVGFYPGQDPGDVRQQVEERIRACAARLDDGLRVQFGRAGFQAPGCVYDLDSPPLQALAQAHAEVHGRPPETLACTATTDGRHFALGTDLPVTNYGPVARAIHGLDEAVELASMQRVATVMARHIQQWCGLVAR